MPDPKHVDVPEEAKRELAELVAETQVFVGEEDGHPIFVQLGEAAAYEVVSVASPIIASKAVEEEREKREAAEEQNARLLARENALLVKVKRAKDARDRWKESMERASAERDQATRQERERLRREIERIPLTRVVDGDRAQPPTKVPRKAEAFKVDALAALDSEVDE